MTTCGGAYVRPVVVIAVIIAACFHPAVGDEVAGAFGSKCSVNSDCQLGFVCENQKCVCNTPYVYDKLKKVCKKICRGSTEGLVKHGSILEQYKLYKNKYTNCSYVEGNLEITGLEMNLDLSFLKDIEEVNGYVLIVNIFSNYLNLTNLRIIRGKTLFKYREEKYSLYVALNHNPKNDSEGLFELQFTSLKEIMRGNAFFLNNNVLCFVNTIKWEDINPTTTPPVKMVFNSMNYKRPCPGCDPACYNSNTKETHCWGSGPDMCQELTFIKDVCSESCNGRCFGKGHNECCNTECAAGCFGPRSNECLACKNFYNDGECYPFCPKKKIYDQLQMKWVDNPEGRYSFGSLCVHDCPSYLVKDDDACVIKCPTGKHPDKVTNECKKCDGPCPKKCQGISDEDAFLHSKNLAQFNGCTIVEGNLRILGVSFLGDRHLGREPITVADLKILKDIKEITGYLVIQEAPPELKNLSFLSGLETIYGRWTSSGCALSVVKMHIESLGLTSLRTITNGNVCLALNKQLCYIENLDMSNVFATPKQSMHSAMNKDYKQCDAEGMKCHSECSRYGCWGPGPDKCLQCRNYRRQSNNMCLANCAVEPLLFEGANKTCFQCHEQCAKGCSGPGPDQCEECKKVVVLGQNGTRECMAECPVPLHPPLLYADENRVCKPCDMACQNGCTGPSTAVKIGGCNTCYLAINRTHENGSVHCLPQDQEYCPAGYYSRQFRSQIYHPLYKKEVCQPCNFLCLTCQSAGNADCGICRFVKYRTEYSTTCVERCPQGTFVSDGHCIRCNSQCLGGCYGPNSTHCNDCMKFKVIISPENNTFNCVETCPPELPHHVQDQNPDKPTMTVCAGDDHPDVLLRKAKEEEIERKKLMTIIIPVVVSIIVLAILLTIFGYCCRQRQRAKENTLKLTARMTGVVETEPLTPTDAKPDLSKLRLIRESELRRGGIIGSGAFGTVYKGFWIPENENVKIPVAIKVLQEGTSPNQNQELLEEARVMASVEHPCCIRILAVCMASQMMLVTQLMPLGCLLDYIRKHMDNTGSKSLLNWCTQIARGMAYLEERGIVHRDLAARNVLVQSAGQVKITDFGLAKLLDYDEEEYHAAGGKMPIKWLALECIQQRIFTHKSDVWSYGVTVWELFTYGRRPYETVRAHEIPDLLEKGERLPQPHICTIDVYMIMIKCWMLDADSRPSFTELAEEFAKMARDPGRYLVIQGDALKKFPSEELLEGSRITDELGLSEGDKLMRLPSYSYDKDDLARHLSVAADGPEEVVEADEYLPAAPAPPPPLAAENNNVKTPLLPGQGASGMLTRDRKYGHLESAAAARKQRELSPGAHCQVDSRYSSDPIRYTRGKDDVDGNIQLSVPSPNYMGNGNIMGPRNSRSPTDPSRGYGNMSPTQKEHPGDLRIPLDENDYLQPQATNPKAYLCLGTGKDYINEKQMSPDGSAVPDQDTDNYLVPTPPAPKMFENPEYFEENAGGDPTELRDSVFESKPSQNRNSVKPKIAPKPKRLTDYYNDVEAGRNERDSSRPLLSASSNCSNSESTV